MFENHYKKSHFTTLRAKRAALIFDFSRQKSTSTSALFGPRTSHHTPSSPTHLAPNMTWLTPHPQYRATPYTPIHAPHPIHSYAPTTLTFLFISMTQIILRPPHTLHTFYENGHHTQPLSYWKWDIFGAFLNNVIHFILLQGALEFNFVFSF